MYFDYLLMNEALGNAFRFGQITRQENSTTLCD